MKLHFFVLYNSYLLPDEEVLETLVRQPFCISLDEEKEDDDVELGDNNKVPIVNKEEEVEDVEEENDANCEDQPKVHLNTETPLKSKVFACNFCRKTYTSKQGLDSHKAGSHLGGIACPSVGCEQRYTSIKGLKKHICKIHNTATFKYNVCDLSLDSYNLLKIHKQEHDSKKKKNICVQVGVWQEIYLQCLLQ